MKQCEKSTHLKFDILLICTLLVISVIAIGILILTRKDGDYVSVEINGEEVSRYSLSTSGKYELNGGSNILIIENGEAWLEYASCPDRTCVKTGKIRYSGQSIICLPNKLSVTVRKTSGEEVDLVS